MEWLASLGYLGLFIGSFLAATVIPFSADFLLIGSLMAGGDPGISFITATTGNWLGSLTSYWLGRIGKWEWIEKWFKVSEEKLLRQKSRIDRYGSLLAFLAWLPFIGDIFAIALGFYKVPFFKCCVFILMGKAARFLAWIFLFEHFGEKIMLFS